MFVYAVSPIMAAIPAIAIGRLKKSTCIYLGFGFVAGNVSRRWCSEKSAIVKSGWQDGVLDL